LHVLSACIEASSGVQGLWRPAIHGGDGFLSPLIASMRKRWRG